ncbi:uncharacterized protein LOC109948655 [Prunus persica]|uniref:uncharacterized protein LOC109948655 n=1 Tax=Prunus persica TaxID=3760 RepID=UPI0009AB6354|nr:uncharacterized protein LOC109948655 [Prunus persica]
MRSILLTRLLGLMLISPPPKDILIGKTIGCGTRRGKLYYLDWAPDSAVKLADISVPNSVTEALEDPKWKEAMNEEMRALQKNVTWELVPLSHRKKTVVCMWIYTVKLKADGSIERYKVRLVAIGYTQIHGIDYEKTFAPVAKINTIKVLWSLAINLD